MTTDLDSRVAQLPVETIAAMLRTLAGNGEALAGFVELLDEHTYDPRRPLDRGAFSFMVLLAADELQVHDSDPGEVLRCLRDSLRLELRGEGSDVPLSDRLAALRPQPTED